MVAPAKDTKTRAKTDEELMAEVREEIRIAEANASTRPARVSNAASAAKSGFMSAAMRCLQKP